MHFFFSRIFAPHSFRYSFSLNHFCFCLALNASSHMISAWHALQFKIHIFQIKNDTWYLRFHFDGFLNNWNGLELMKITNWYTDIYTRWLLCGGLKDADKNGFSRFNPFLMRINIRHCHLLAEWKLITLDLFEMCYFIYKNYSFIKLMKSFLQSK